jgi:hypothetical protein
MIRHRSCLYFKKNIRLSAFSGGSGQGLCRFILSDSTASYSVFVHSLFFWTGSKVLGTNNSMFYIHDDSKVCMVFFTHANLQAKKKTFSQFQLIPITSCNKDAIVWRTSKLLNVYSKSSSSGFGQFSLGSIPSMPAGTTSETIQNFCLSNVTEDPIFRSNKMLSGFKVQSFRSRMTLTVWWTLLSD